MKLALGTVQFGLNYGAFNQTGQVSDSEVAAILHHAETSGIDTLDTARAYGTSEAVLGHHNACARFRVVTKIKALSKEASKASAVVESLSESRAALGVETLDTVLFHSAPDLLGADGARAWAAAEAARDAGQLRRLGVSVYDHDEAMAISARFPVQAIQLPINIFDQRAIASGALAALKDRGIEIHARSAFLQGFALADPEALPLHLIRFQAQLEAFHAFATEAGTTPLSAALGFVLAQDAIDRVVVGVQSLVEFKQVVASAKECPDLVDAHDIASEDQALLNPSRWL